MKAGDEELREKPGATVWGCCVGDDSGELLASDDRSDALEMETSCWGDESEALLTEGGARHGQAAATHVRLGQQVGAELEVVFEVKGAAGLELDAKGRQGGRLVDVLDAAAAAELAVGVLRDGEAGGSAIAAAAVVVIVRHGDGMRHCRGEMVVGGHGCVVQSKLQGFVEHAVARAIGGGAAGGRPCLLLS